MEIVQGVQGVQESTESASLHCLREGIVPGSGFLRREKVYLVYVARFSYVPGIL